MIEIQFLNETAMVVDQAIWIRTVRQICEDHGITQGEVSLAVVDDETIHSLNREHLQHDYPTDVLSFVLEHASDCFAGEVIVSADTAQRMAEQFGWSPADELLLYCIHGSLHLVGYDDHAAEDLDRMRQQEDHYLRVAGVTRGKPRPNSGNREARV